MRTSLCLASLHCISRTARTLLLPAIGVLMVSVAAAAFGQTSPVDYPALVDEHDTPLPGPLPTGWFFNAMGGDRGTLNGTDVTYSLDGDSAYRAQVVAKPPGALWTWGGMWYSLVRQNGDDVPLDFAAVFGRYVKPEWQGQVVEVQIVVNRVTSPSSNPSLVLKVELKTPSGTLAQPATSFPLSPVGSYPATLRVPVQLASIAPVEQLLWVLDGAQIGDEISVERVTMTVRVPSLAPEEQAFLWSFAWLMNNYNPSTGMVKDKSRDGRLPVADGGGDSMESVSATAKAAKIAYYAWRKGYVTQNDAVGVITKIADTLINVVPRGPAGTNSLWPHFTENGGTRAVPPRNGAQGSEWASGDTAFAALDIIAALKLIGDPNNQIPALDAFVRNINWAGLLDGGAISHGYSYDGVLIPSTWRGFGMETIGVLWAYGAATGHVTSMLAPPSDNGSGFIDNAAYPLAHTGRDRWTNDWETYRLAAADTQIGWFCKSPNLNPFLCGRGMFGLSAAEYPEPNGLYEAWGVGGRLVPPVDGNDDVVVLHYAGMIADLRPTAARAMWDNLLARNGSFLQNRIVISPLNNMESMRVDKTTGRPTVNHLKGSWNLALQAEGWALASTVLRQELRTAVRTNPMLARGHALLNTEQCVTAKRDFNADGKGDILWRNDSSGANSIWLMDGITRTAGLPVPAVTNNPDWVMVSVADFNADGKGDILWRNTAAGQNSIWLMDGATRTLAASIPSVPTPWRVYCSADLSGDGKADIFWRNETTGANSIWLMDGVTRIEGLPVPAVTAPGWSIVAVADYDGGGKADILWRNEMTGANSIWIMDGAVRVSALAVPSVPVDWKVFGSTDFNADGMADILWRNATTGANSIWLMNGATRTAGLPLPGVTVPGWAIFAAVDHDGDAKGDILWRNILTGQNSIWLMDGATRRTAATIPTVPVDWKVIGK